MMNVKWKDAVRSVYLTNLGLVACIYKQALVLEIPDYADSKPSFDQILGVVYSGKLFQA